ncbi:MAG TPA: hypothetical protein VMZ69_05885 [Saprospiraceae bacterium]|nr:hypothetical protein [Saprospiraceae bacterium]
MKSIQLFCILALILVISSCKQDKSTQQEEMSVENKEMAADTNSSHVSGGHDQTFLTDKLLHYKASNTIGADSKEDMYAGQWIDMDPDGTYKAGKLKEQTHTGRWDYNPEAKVLLLRPDDPNLKASEWNVMYNNNMIVFVGTQTYGNNSTQIKLERSAELP